MSHNAALDVAIALILMYLMLSLLCTVINEFIATKLKLRAKALAAALEQLLDNQTLREAFYRHGLIVSSTVVTATGTQSTVSGLNDVARATANVVSKSVKSIRSSLTADSNRQLDVAVTVPNIPTADAQAPTIQGDHPTYLSSRNVALALLGSLDRTKPLPGIPDIQQAVLDLPPSRIRDALLSSLTEADNSLDKLRKSIATWFDDSMERLSGAYKRQLKWISMLTGLCVAIVFNADSFNVATTLWNDQDRRSSIVAIAASLAQESDAGTSRPVDEISLQEAIKKTESTLRSFPIGWNCATKDATAASAGSSEPHTLGYWECAKTKLPTVTLMQALGWVFTTVALTLGAPFWFDLLQKFINIRGAGGKPKRADEKATA